MEQKMKAVVDIIQRTYKDAKVECHEIVRNNGTIKHGLTIRMDDDTVLPLLHLEPFMSSNDTLENIASQIIDAYNRALYIRPDVSRNDIITSYDIVKKSLKPRLINTEWNCDMLLGVPHKNIYDLSIILILDVCETKDTVGCVRVTNEFLDIWGVTFEQAYQDALQNFNASNIACERLTSILETMGVNLSSLDMTNGVLDLYVLSDKKFAYGTNYVLYREYMDGVSDLFGGDLLLIPSSIHEWIFMKFDENFMGSEALTDVIRQVNIDILDPSDKLSDHPYLYKKGVGLTIFE